MKKKWIITVLMTTCMLSACGRTGDEEVPGQLSSVSLEKQPDEEIPEDYSENGAGGSSENADLGTSSPTETSESTMRTDPETKFCLDDLRDRCFYFSSGVGAWSTELFINGDGSFEGNYHDADMGDTGEDYPNGIMYFSSFSGGFGEPEKIDDFTYKLKLAYLEFDEIPETEEIMDGVRWIYSTAYGLDGGENFYLYLPGAPLSELPEEYLQWVGYHDSDSISGTELPFYGLYNADAQTGFSSSLYERPGISERIQIEIDAAAAVSADLDAKLQEAETQGDMNMISAQMYETWDETLNIIWKLLESDLNEAAMEKLRAEEREWIAQKEELITAAGMEYEGGSMQPMAESLKAAELTEERVYELAAYAE
ncbi:MAG: DUF1311 domain-containing protein [Lachnospiraceae bacterium]|jgi:uncharacterized protein YecT (DUF1311 family)|nr:DUF1311 domain-containing protein [Lachnospiraceae bacterium]